MVITFESRPHDVIRWGQEGPEGPVAESIGIENTAEKWGRSTQATSES